uniref:Uncharacterized protein n=1 Tax=Daphnia galeata TaxID=27404 RepID=A0A8J2RUP8_9CRUS|nr:unnamed protein product [Daphnia galeata]
MADGEKQRLNSINSPEVVTVAPVQEMQSSGKLDVPEKDRIGFWESDIVHSETYGEHLSTIVKQRTFTTADREEENISKKVLSGKDQIGLSKSGKLASHKWGIIEFSRCFSPSAMLDMRSVTNPHLVDRRGVSTDAARRQTFFHSSSMDGIPVDSAAFSALFPSYRLDEILSPISPWVSCRGKGAKEDTYGEVDEDTILTIAETDRSFHYHVAQLLHYST